MIFICDFLEAYMNIGIYILAVIEMGLAIRSGCYLYKLKKRIKHLNDPIIKDKGRARKIGKGKVVKEGKIAIEKDWDEFDRFLEDYQEKGRTYYKFSLFIQIFTLLGILGTVAGLYISVNEGQDIYEGVKFALSSTILGIIFAVIYKFVDIIFEASFVNYIEDGITRFKGGYSVDKEESICNGSAIPIIKEPALKNSGEES